MPARCGMLSRTITIMLRWARRIVIFLLLGAIANVAVAWGCVLAQHDRAGRQRLLRHEVREKRSYIQASFGFGYAYVMELPGAGGASVYVPTKRPLYDGRTWWPTAPRDEASHRAHLGCGWPMLSLSATLTPVVEQASAIHWRMSVHRAIVMDSDVLMQPLSSTIPMVLPYRPVWIGFSANTLMYALAVGGLFAGVSISRRAIRRKRGQCIHCAYPRGTSPVCTECGEPLPGAAVK